MRTHWEPLLLLVLGCGLAYGTSWWFHRRRSRNTSLALRTWRSRRDWRQGYIRNNSRCKLGKLLLIFIATVYAFPVLYDDWGYWNDLEYYVAFATLHVAAPVVFIWTIRSFVIARKFAKARLIGLCVFGPFRREAPWTLTLTYPSSTQDRFPLHEGYPTHQYSVTKII